MKTIAAALTLLIAAAAPADVLEFEKTPYGLLFADIEVAGKPVRAMIDFGDPAVLSLATSFIDEHGLEAEPTGETMMYADGTTFQRLQGRVGSAIIGGQRLESVRFSSASGEIEAVAAQVGTPFEAVVGWGFFGTRPFVLDYAEGRFEFGLEACPAGADAIRTRNPGNSYPGHSYLIVDGMLGKRPTRLLLDTGHPINVVDRKLLDDDRLAGEAVTIEHVAGRVDGRELTLTFDDWQRPLAFQPSDMKALEPLGVDAILGQPFLESLTFCHEAGSGQLHFYERRPDA
jgi:hypothetical protein